MKNKSGISLLALIITIIVVIILSTAVIISIANSNIINNATTAVRENNQATIHEALNYNALITGEYYIKSSPFLSVIGGNLKTYIESKIGRSLEATVKL